MIITLTYKLGKHFKLGDHMIVDLYVYSVQTIEKVKTFTGAFNIQLTLIQEEYLTGTSNKRIASCNFPEHLSPLHNTK